ncbi:serine/threonine-protein kinase [Nonomuraea gerenzanensis]|uniref:non-specific serine/threonine protein kinase n=1 Tax=Nonomuraea gerenzanensis TaxID=93944 RepID=A0A1M4DXT9_9ACTN|nr:serine/threonine-protein kinase [Nonomuraea gerenzanensis]UBU13701.1 protein kinase [Nonomuraea gerenzanensis]SBO91369.1 serine/threonine protein kinase [Nonomuraea gerenzanensis]
MPVPPGDKETTVDRDGGGAVTLLAGRYRLLDQLGQGGMGTVWRAMDELLRQEVAIKEVKLPPDLDQAARTELADRTLREARAAAALRDHPSIVTVHDVVLDDGRPWIVMELVRGRALDRVVRDEGPLPPGRVAGIGLRMIEALSAAHASGILHRDVKPANVMLTDDGRVLLTDFGIATIAGDVALTQTGLLSGSPGYIAPERLRGEPDGPPADLWSLGATLFTAVEGAPPFSRHNEAAVLAAVLMQEPAPFRLAGPLGPVLAAILEKDPARRCTPEQATGWLTAIAQGTDPPAHLGATGARGTHPPGASGTHPPIGPSGPAGTHPPAGPGGSAVTHPPIGPGGHATGPPFGQGQTMPGRRRRRRTKVLLGATLALVLTAAAAVVVVPQVFPNAIRLIGYALAPRTTYTPSPRPSATRTTPAPALIGEFEACDLLTNAQVRSLFGHSVKRQWVVESSCTWRGGSFQVLTLMAYRAPSASLADMMHKQTVKMMQDEPKRTPGTKVRQGPSVGDGGFSHTGPMPFSWQGSQIYSTKVAFTQANVSVTITVQGGKRGYAAADKAAELVSAALGKRGQGKGTG